jgi:hypothetical protein
LKEPNRWGERIIVYIVNVIASDGTTLSIRCDHYGDGMLDEIGTQQVTVNDQSSIIASNDESVSFTASAEVTVPVTIALLVMVEEIISQVLEQLQPPDQITGIDLSD